MAEVLIASNSTAQQVADGLPSYRMYQDTPGSPNLPGPRTPGTSSAGDGTAYSAAGYIQGGPQDPTPSPQQSGAVAAQVPGMRAPTKLTPPPQKLLWEPAQYVQGKGWVTSATNATAG